MNSTNPARDLTLRLQDLLREERAALGDFVLLLADFDRRKLWLALGHSSLFYFLHRELGLSKGAAFYRKTTAELVQRFPEVIEPLRDGRLCLTSVVELAKVLTPSNREEVLPRFFQLSKREAKAVSAAILPCEAVPRRDVVTAVRVPVALVATLPGRAELQADLDQAAVHPANQIQINSEREPASAGSVAGPFTAESRQVSAVHPANQIQISSPRRPPPDEVEPLTADLSRVHMTVPRSYHEKLAALRAALSHSHPGASAGELIEAALDLALEQLAKRRGLVKKPRREPPPSKPEHVPAHVRRAVWKRDGGKCQWPLESGGICGSTHQVELDHVRPRALGGPRRSRTSVVPASYAASGITCIMPSRNLCRVGA